MVQTCSMVEWLVIQVMVWITDYKFVIQANSQAINQSHKALTWITNFNSLLTKWFHYLNVQYLDPHFIRIPKKFLFIIQQDYSLCQKQQLLVMLGDSFMECKEWRKAEALYKDALQQKKQIKPLKKCR